MHDSEKSHFNYQIILDSILVGLVAGCGAVGYRYLLGYASQASGWMYSHLDIYGILAVIAFLLLSAWITYKLLVWAPYSGGSGIPQVMGEFSGLMNMQAGKIVVSKYVGGLLSMLAGMSLGREGPSIQIGSALGKMTSSYLKRDLTKERILITAGAAAGLASAFNAPIAATLFVMEEVHKNIGTRILLPALLASLTSDFISKLVFGMDPSFHIRVQEAMPWQDYGYLIGLGLVTAVVGYCFSQLLLSLQTLNKRFIPNIWLRVTLGFLVAGLTGYFLFNLTGSGHDKVVELLNQPAGLQFLVLFLAGKLIYTCICYDSGVPGGIFLPVLVLGALSGMVYFQGLTSLGLDVDPFMRHFVIFGMAGILTAVVRSPITSILLVSEMTGSLSHILSIAIVAAVAYLATEVVELKPIYDSLYERMFDNVKAINLSPEKVTLQYVVPAFSDLVGMEIKDMALPEDALIIDLVRSEVSLIPRGRTRLAGLDQLTIMCNLASAGQVRDYFRRLGDDAGPAQSSREDLE
ncbi:ClC family H(+)/Cl(-) exchange transporter [Eremococcus coleocola]|uniref:ClC family H(+)/Cl(-) exchange transporter n=1 Tax=Eremococcus coleocola TaxID=88132 RepID=UPI00042A483C|nr:ClC family H(+)/Cl(-) exchange transporter [Eremococcus coleocola]